MLFQKVCPCVFVLCKVKEFIDLTIFAHPEEDCPYVDIARFLHDFCGCPSFLGHCIQAPRRYEVLFMSYYFSNVTPDYPLDVAVDGWKVAEGFPDSEVFYSLVFNSFHVYAYDPSHG
jgi:hypothetical protein